VAGHPVHDGHDLVRETIAREVGQPVDLEIVRGGQHYGAHVVLSERPEANVEPVPVQQQAAPHQGMGLVVRDLPPQQAQAMNLPAKPFPVVTQVTPGSAADRAGMRAGDVVVEANGQQDPTSAQVAEDARSGALLLRVKREDSYFYAALKK
jgi:S1-C subfamily serine protease